MCTLICFDWSQLKGRLCSAWHSIAYGFCNFQDHWTTCTTTSSTCITKTYVPQKLTFLTPTLPHCHHVLYITMSPCMSSTWHTLTCFLLQEQSRKILKDQKLLCLLFTVPCLRTSGKLFLNIVCECAAFEGYRKHYSAAWVSCVNALSHRIALNSSQYCTT